MFDIVFQATRLHLSKFTQNSPYTIKYHIIQGKSRKSEKTFFSNTHYKAPSTFFLCSAERRNTDIDSST